MDPVTTIVAAVIAGIAAGTASGATEVSKQVIVGAYGGLKTVLKRRFGESSDVVDAVNRLESKPESAGYKQVLEEELEAVKAEQDGEVLDAAQKVLDQAMEVPELEQHIQTAIGSYIAQADRGSTATVKVSKLDE